MYGNVFLRAKNFYQVERTPQLFLFVCHQNTQADVKITIRKTSKKELVSRNLLKSWYVNKISTSILSIKANCVIIDVEIGQFPRIAVTGLNISFSRQNFQCCSFSRNCSEICMRGKCLRDQSAKIYLSCHAFRHNGDPMKATP